MEIVLTLKTCWKGVRSPQRVLDHSLRAGGVDGYVSSEQTKSLQTQSPPRVGVSGFCIWMTEGGNPSSVCLGIIMRWLLEMRSPSERI